MNAEKKLNLGGGIRITAPDGIDLDNPEMSNDELLKSLSRDLSIAARSYLNYILTMKAVDEPDEVVRLVRRFKDKQTSILMRMKIVESGEPWLDFYLQEDKSSKFIGGIQQ
jgi:hypothetical protein